MGNMGNAGNAGNAGNMGNMGNMSNFRQMASSLFNKPPPIIKHIEISLKEAYNGKSHPLPIKRWIMENGVKVFEEERELTVVLIVDISASGAFGSQSQKKTNISAEIASVLGFSAIKNNDKVGLILFSDEVVKYLPPKKFVKLLQKKFSPYCSVATWYLWRSIDPEPIQY